MAPLEYLWKWYFVLQSLMSYPDPLLECLCKNSKFHAAKPTRLSFCFLWIHVWNQRRLCQSEIEGNKVGWFDWARHIRKRPITWCSEHVGTSTRFDRLLCSRSSSIGWRLHWTNTLWSIFAHFTEERNHFYYQRRYACLINIANPTTCMLLTAWPDR